MSTVGPPLTSRPEPAETLVWVAAEGANTASLSPALAVASVPEVAEDTLPDSSLLQDARQRVRAALVGFGVFTALGLLLFALRHLEFLTVQTALRDIAPDLSRGPSLPDTLFSPHLYDSLITACLFGAYLFFAVSYSSAHRILRILGVGGLPPRGWSFFVLGLIPVFNCFAIWFLWRWLEVKLTRALQTCDAGTPDLRKDNSLLTLGCAVLFVLFFLQHLYGRFLLRQSADNPEIPYGQYLALAHNDLGVSALSMILFGVTAIIIGVFLNRIRAQSDSLCQFYTQTPAPPSPSAPPDPYFFPVTD